MAGTAHWTGEEPVAFSTLSGLRFEPDQTRDDLSDTQLDAVEATPGMEVTRTLAESVEQAQPEPTPQPAPEPAPVPPEESPAAENVAEPPAAAQE